MPAASPASYDQPVENTSRWDRGQRFAIARSSIIVALSVVACGDDAEVVLDGPVPDAAIDADGSSRRLLTPADITYLGYYEIGESVYGSGLTHRYVDDELRLIYTEFVAEGVPAGASPYVPTEVRLPANFGERAVEVARWGQLFAPAQNFTGRDIWLGLWWEAGADRLWTTSAYDYPQGEVTTEETMTLATRELRAGEPLATGHRGFWGFAGIGQRALYGGVQPVPPWFQQAHGVGAYVTGWGGYTSRLSQGLNASLGPMLVFFDDPHGVADAPMLAAANLPATAARIGGDARSGAVSMDWYPGGYAARTFDRGVRGTTCANYFDGGDPRQNPSTPPTDPPQAGAQWLHPVPGDPRGEQRWVWGDTYSNNLQWIEPDPEAGTSGRHGIVAVLDAAYGKAFYMTSALHYDARQYELHVFDPADVASVLAGAIPPWALRPTSIATLALPGKGYPEQLDQAGGIKGMTYDARTSTLYLMGYWAGTPPTNRLYAFSVGR